MQLPGFVGGSNVLQSDLADPEWSINLRQESTAPGNAKVPAYLQRTPGLAFDFSVGSDPIQGLFSLNGRCFGVSGTTFFEILTGPPDSFVVRGTVAAATNDFPLATICSNGSAGNQVFITSGGNGYIYNMNTNTTSQIADLDFPTGFALMGEFFAGYFLVSVINSRTVQWSALEDGTSWDALDVMERSWAPDNINFIKRNGTHIWIGGKQTSEVWYATGDVAVFAPAQESLIEHGSVSGFSAVRIETEGSSTLAWLDQSERGGGLAVVAVGLNPQTISTYAIARYEQQREDHIQHARCFAIQMDGHVDYVLNNSQPDFDKTPVFDFTEKQWHFRAGWDSTNCVWLPWRAQCHCYFDQRHFVGDRLTGAIYTLSMDNLTDELAAA